MKFKGEKNKQSYIVILESTSHTGHWNSLKRRREVDKHFTELTQDAEGKKVRAFFLGDEPCKRGARGVNSVRK